MEMVAKDVSAKALSFTEANLRAAFDHAQKLIQAKSETTLRIAGLHFEIGAFPGAAPDQFELPPGASNARHRQWGCRERADAPAGDGCRRLAEIGRLCRPPQRRMARPMVPEPSAAS
jgi:hypothetical protein